MHQALLAIIISIGLGVWVGVTSSSSSMIAIGLIILSALQGGIIFWCKGVSTIAKYSSLVALMIALGIIRAQFIELPSAYLCERSCTVKAEVISLPEVKDAYQQFDVRVSDEYAYIRVRAPLYPRVQLGEELSLTGKIEAPGVIYPHGADRAFDYSLYLGNKNVGSQMYYPKFVSEGKGEESLLTSLGAFRLDLIERIARYVRSPGDSLATGMLLGNQNMTSELLATFRVAGLSHIIVLSGFNIAILTATLLYVLFLLPLFIRIAFATSTVILFVMMVGATPSVVRAMLMALVALLALTLGREYVARQALLFSLLLVMLYSPLSPVSDVSLNLSFLATAGIIYLVPVMEPLFRSWKSVMYRELVVTTLAAYLATLPYIMHTFGSVSLYAILANLIVLPLVSPIMLLAFLTLVSSVVWSPLAMVFGYVTTALSMLVIWVARTIEVLPYSSVQVDLGLSGMVLLYACLAIGCLLLFFHKKDETLVTKNQEILSGVMSY